MRLGIVGNVAIDKHQGELAWYIIHGLICVLEPAEVWSGGATGIDSVAEECARQLGYGEGYPERPCVQGGMCPGCTSACWAPGRLVICRPEIEAWEPDLSSKKGYKARNLEIVNGVDKLVRISKHSGGNRTYGSGWTADRAEERLGAENVYRYYI